MSRDFEIKLTLLLTELDIKPLGDREIELYNELKSTGIFAGSHMTELVASIVFYTQREIRNYVDMVEICREIGAKKKSVFKLVGKLSRHYGTPHILANPSVISRVDKLSKQIWKNRITDSNVNYLLEGFNKYELLANEHGLHKGKGYYAAVAYILLKPLGHSQESICDYIICTPVSLRLNIKLIKSVGGMTVA